MPIHLFLLAIIQGITEFLPISSSAHLILLPVIMQIEDQGVLIDIAAHGGSLLAVMLYFRREVLDMANGAIAALCGNADHRSRELGFLIIATLPIVLIGGALFLSGYSDAFRSPKLIAATTIGFGLLLGLSDRFPAKAEASHLSFKYALMIGIAQCFAVLPGTSRSGVTMTAARALGMPRQDSARISMLLAIPTILLAVLAASAKLATQDLPEIQSEAMIVAALSFVTAIGALHGLLSIIARIGFLPFVVYRLLLGGMILLSF